MWLAGVLVLTARLMVGSLSLARLVRRASEAPGEIVRECRAIAARLGCRGVVPVRLTSDVAIPCLAGLWNPVLLLPERECEDVAHDDLRAILAHELAHARNHDLAWNLAGHLASIVLWFHPLAWWIRAAHAAACDAVCDAVAADLLGDPASYGRTLARLAVRAARPSWAHGLAMARSSDVRRRLAALNREVFRTPLSWRRVVFALCLGSMLLVLVGGFGFTRAEPAKAASTPQTGEAARATDEKTASVLTKGPTVTGRVVDAAGLPVKGARAWIGGDNWVPNPPTGTTNERGEFILENCDRGRWFITVQAEGFAPKIGDVRVEAHTSPVEIQLTEPGSVVRGKVVDIQGQPVAAAFVGADTWRGHRLLHFRVDTDKDGRFEWKSAPKDVVLYDTGKLGYMSSRHVPLTASDREQVVTLYPELVITGRVSDGETGRPVPRFRLIRGQRYEGREKTHWAENEAVEITGGRYTIRFSEAWGALLRPGRGPGLPGGRLARLPVDRGESDVRLRPPARRGATVRRRPASRRQARRGSRGRARHAGAGLPDAGGAIRSPGECPESHCWSRRPVHVYTAR